MKYEMFFGDDGLFFDAQKDCEMVGNGHHKVENGKLMVWNFSEKYWAESHTNKITIAAMRRIIPEPKRWTVEDQKAGKLPDVGAEFKARGYVWECVRILNNTILAVVGDSYCGFDIDECKPIESPEEKAARLRSEWISKAYVDFHRLGCELEALQKEQIKVIYDAMLSGDLPVPVKGE